MQPAQTVLTYQLANGSNYIDLAEGLSAVNRRAYRQGMEYAVGKIDYLFKSAIDQVASVSLKAMTAGNTWVVHNAWKKAQAHWLAQQRNARSLIGESGKPSWEDFKVYLDDGHRAAGSKAVQAGDLAAVSGGEWDYSRFIWEDDSHNIDEVYLHMIGGDVSTTDWGLILGYQDSRATVQPTDPDLPNEYSNNMYALMAQDENAVADEVAQNMEDENDQPPYDQDDYPGSDVNSDAPWIQQFTSCSVGSPSGTVGAFVAQCGLLKLDIDGVLVDGSAGPAPTTTIQVHLVPGNYKGVLAEPMGQ